MTVETPIGTADRVLPVARELPRPETPAMLGGYEQDRSQLVAADIECAVLGLAQDAAGHLLIRHSCAGTRGVSGAPLLVRVAGGGWAVAGVASTAGLGASGGNAVPVAALLRAGLGME